MSASGPKPNAVEIARMATNERQFWAGVALLVVAGALLFGATAVGGLDVFSQASGAVAVLGLAGSAVLIGTAGDERPV
ncbi:hypothetical protein M0R88_14910 [Halorussus gelatinilyticus]|uniref:Uncharacterized protein n=1 Tax=Halorussus gelatinilyticus TaxID=2937524 RepID=A0A8U0IFY6_9EURY|nr:hypothetical protein [Halorussus gelatinilyticus]UPV99797.1 hypothetical protein M0R88_14910 [Halorussus gelatinilyticus]